MDLTSLRAQRPNTVTLAVALAIAVTVIGGINSYFFTQTSMAEFQAQGLDMESSGMMLVLSALAGLALMALLAFFILRGGNIARWIYTVFSVIGVLSSLLNFSIMLSIAPISGAIAIVSQLVVVGTIVLLFLPKSAQWFEQIKQAKQAPVAA